MERYCGKYRSGESRAVRQKQWIVVELWIIPAQGAPLAAGVFKPDEHGNAVMMDQNMPAGVEAKAFAITVENEEGSDKPTSPIMLMGEVPAGA